MCARHEKTAFCCQHCTKLEKNKYLCCNRAEFDTIKMSECVLHFQCFNVSMVAGTRSPGRGLRRFGGMIDFLYNGIDDGRSSIDMAKDISFKICLEFSCNTSKRFVSINFEVGLFVSFSHSMHIKVVLRL